MCPVVNGGVVNITRTIITPTKGSQGTEFTLGITYNVLKPIGPGLLSIFIQPPEDEPLGDAEFQEGQDVGSYSISWKLNTQPSEQESFSPGTYQVQMAVCEVRLTNKHSQLRMCANFNQIFQSRATAPTLTHTLEFMLVLLVPSKLPINLSFLTQIKFIKKKKKKSSWCFRVLQDVLTH